LQGDITVVICSLHCCLSYVGYRTERIAAH